MKDEERQAYQQDAAVKHTTVHHAGIGPEEEDDALQKHQAYQLENDAREETHRSKHGENPVGLGVVAFAKALGHQGATSRAQHRAYHAYQKKERHHQVDCGKGRFAHEVGDKDTGHHAVDGREDHRGDGGQREAQQLAVAEMVGEGDGGYGGFELGCENTIILKNTSILTPYLYLFTYLRINYRLFLLLNYVF